MSLPIKFHDRNSTYYEFANGYEQPVELEGLTWPTVEHYLIASKFLPEETALREQIRTARTPKKAKLLADARVSVRSDWEEIRDDQAREALKVKFSDPVLRKKLMNTGTRDLIENSPFDTYWGVGRRGDGLNRLGSLLMELRQQIKSEG